MMTFFKTYLLDNIKNKFLILYILNITDIAFTLFLLDTGFYMEANFLMVKAVQSTLASFILKVLLPAALLVYLYIRMQKATVTQLKQSNIFINICILIYVLINVSHLIWLVMIPFFMNL